MYDSDSDHQDQLYDAKDDIGDENIESFFDDEETRKKKYGVKKITFNNLAQQVKAKFAEEDLTSLM